MIIIPKLIYRLNIVNSVYNPVSNNLTIVHTTGIVILHNNQVIQIYDIDLAYGFMDK